MASGSFGARRINKLATSKVWHPRPADNFSVYCIGDSQWGDTAGLTDIAYSVGPLLMQLLGWPSMVMSGAGGRGTVIGGGGASNAYNFNLMPDMNRANSFRPIGAVIYQASGNDNQSAGAAQTAIFNQALL